MMGNLGGLMQVMKQLQQAQQRAEELRQQLADERLEAGAGGLVTCVANGLGEVLEVRINGAEMGLGDEDVEMLQDALLAALREIAEQASEKGQGLLQEITGGLQLPPGLGL